MDYVDVLFCHRPDPNTPIEETVRAMNWVIDQGWALYWGTSEWSAEQILEVRPGGGGGAVHEAAGRLLGGWAPEESVRAVGRPSTL